MRAAIAFAVLLSLPAFAAGETPITKAVSFDYSYSHENLDPHAMHLKLEIRDQALLALNGNLFATFVSRELTNQKLPLEKPLYLDIEQDGTALVTLEDLEPSTAYSIEVTFSLLPKDGSKFGTALSRASAKFYGVTAAEGGILKGAALASRALEELARWKKDPVQGHRQAYTKASGGWGFVFVEWIAEQEGLNARTPTADAPIPKTAFDLKLGDILVLKGNGGINKSVVLGTDQAGYVWGVEGNSNNQVEIRRRPLTEITRYFPAESLMAPAPKAPVPARLFKKSVEADASSK
ncbi:hypothetical protein K2X33_15090 [bacterium]|nr:hypothetical protein [bacterium]